MRKTLFLYSSDKQLVTALRENNEAAIQYVFNDEEYNYAIKQAYCDIVVKHRCRLKLNDLRDGFKFKMLHNNCEAMSDYEKDPSSFKVWLMVKAEKYFNACGREHDKKMVENIVSIDDCHRVLREKDTEYVFKGKEYKSLFEILHYKYVKSFKHQLDVDEMVHGIYSHLGEDNHKRLKKYDSGRDFFDGWLYKTGRNFIINYFKKKTEELLDSDESSPVEDEGINLFRSVEIAQDVRMALSKLPTNYQEVLRKRYFEGKEPQVIAKEMGKSRKNVDTLHTRAKAKLCQLLIVYADEYGGTKESKKQKKKYNV